MPDVENAIGANEKQILVPPSEKLHPTVFEWKSIPWFVKWTTYVTIPCSITTMLWSISQNATWYPTIVAVTGYLFFFMFRSMTGGLRYCIMRWWIGVEHETIASVFGTKALDLNGLFVNKDMFAIRAVDGLSRKSGHILMWMAYPMILSYVSPNEHLTISAVWGFLMVVVTVMFTPMDNVISNAYWGGCVRVWDGHLRRANELFTSQIGSFWTFVMLHIVMGTLIHPLLPYEVFGLLPQKMVVIPCAIGDAMAEIVGSLFGRNFFQVSGLGEINKKTVEGCVAFVLSTMAVLFATLSMECHMRFWLYWEWYALATAVSIFGMFAETLSFRGTDNIVIMATSASVLALGARYLNLAVPVGLATPSFVQFVGV